MLSAFSKIKSEKFRLKDTVEVWNLKFKSWDTDFGEVLTIHHELFDVNGMSDCGFAMDPEYLSKKHMCLGHVTYSTLQKAGIRRTDAGSYPRGELPVSALCKGTCTYETG